MCVCVCVCVYNAKRKNRLTSRDIRLDPGGRNSPSGSGRFSQTSSINRSRREAGIFLLSLREMHLYFCSPRSKNPTRARKLWRFQLLLSDRLVWFDWKCLDCKCIVIDYFESGYTWKATRVFEKNPEIWEDINLLNVTLKEESIVRNEDISSSSTLGSTFSILALSKCTRDVLKRREKTNKPPKYQMDDSSEREAAFLRDCLC